MQTFYTLSRLGLIIVSLSITETYASEKDKEATTDKPTVTTQTPTPTGNIQDEKPAKDDKVEKWGKESGDIVDIPANLAHRLGEKINKALGNKDDS